MGQPFRSVRRNGNQSDLGFDRPLHSLFVFDRPDKPDSALGPAPLLDEVVLGGSVRP